MLLCLKASPLYRNIQIIKHTKVTCNCFQRREETTKHDVVRCELALGMEAEMDGGVWVSESPLAPLKGGDQQLPWPVAAGHCSGQPDGAAFSKVIIGYGL